jgi:hypothetical protein
MSAERVDKQWRTKGLSGFSSAAILGTLNHYGVSVDETAFKQLAEKQYPLQIAGAWKLSWKGTGPFATFPYAAADELMRRAYPDRITPAALAEKIVLLLARAADLVAGKEVQLGESFDVLERLLPSLPPVGEVRTLFTSELVGFLERFAEAFEHAPRELLAAGKPDEARRMGALQESIFPDRVGVVSALLEAHGGARDAGVEKLSALAARAEGRSIFTRYWALDALFQLDAEAVIKAHGLALFDDAAQEKRWPLADTVIHLVAKTMERSSTLQADPVFVEAVVARFEEAHRQVGHHG